MIDSKFRKLRTIVRSKSKEVIDHIDLNHVHRGEFKRNDAEICVFCYHKNSITKEHVLPTWAFANCPQKYFDTDINGIKQFYIKAVIPACSNCNNNILGSIEKYIYNLFKNTNLKESYFSIEEKQNIIRWLELIEYKFQILEVRKKYLVSKEYGYIKYLADLPISVLRENVDFSPSKAIQQIRNSNKRIATKSKIGKENSLVIFKSKNKAFDFFHSIENFVFLQIPEFQIALFYFYNRDYSKQLDAYNDAIEIIKNQGYY